MAFATKEPKKEEHQSQKATSILSKARKNLVKAKRFKNNLIVAGLIFLCLIIILSIILGHNGKLSIVSETALKDILEISELSTLEYAYNSIVSVSDGDNIKYHVAYKGNVKAGIDFNKISTTYDKSKKKIYINIPSIKITSVNVDNQSLDFIFTKNKYQTETVFQEAYQKCTDDLQKKAKSNERLHTMAKENAISTVKALLIPWETSLPNGYTVEYK